MRSRIKPLKKIVRSLRDHCELILNYFRAQKLLSSGIVEGLNNKAKVTMRKSYGFRTLPLPDDSSVSANPPARAGAWVVALEDGINGNCTEASQGAAIECPTRHRDGS